MLGITITIGYLFVGLPIYTTILLLGLPMGFTHEHSGIHSIDNGHEPAVPGIPFMIGGTIVDGREFPAMVSIQWKWGEGWRHQCAGSILNPEWILTTATCTTALPVNAPQRVYAGSNDNLEGGTEHIFVKVILHEKFGPSVSRSYDIAVMKVNPPIILGDGVDFVQLPTKGVDTPGGVNGTALGWGDHNPGVDNRKLRKIVLDVVDRDVCNETYGHQYFMPIQETQFCAGGDGRGDVCGGDGGGPFFLDGEIVGMISWGWHQCNLKEFPTVYTQVSDFIDWIQEKTKE